MNKTVGLINPGAMGTPAGRAAVLSGARVIWVSAGRSHASVERAGSVGLESVAGMGSLVEASDVILSVCPPHAALDVCREVLTHRFEGIYVDANAVSPQTAERMEEIVTGGGASFVDASIIGGPPKRRGTTRLYLAGTEAKQVVGVLEEGDFDLVVLGETVGAASAIKMAYAAWTKGSAALLLAIRALARSQGVEAALLNEWAMSLPDVGPASDGAVTGSVPKAWRFSGEMEQIAATFETGGLPNGFHQAAARIYDRLADFKDHSDPPVDEVLRRLLRD